MNAEELKSRIDLPSFIGRYTTLKRKGRDFVGLCPFHTEKTGSFHVNGQRWRCFGACNTGGDVFDFLMLHDHIDFLAATRLIAQELGIEVDDLNARRLTTLLREVANVYHKHFNHHSGIPAQHYFRRRGFTPEDNEQWNIGWTNRAMTMRMINHFGKPILIEAGIIREGKHGDYDPMADRLIIPISDHGQVVGFAGRTINHVEPKYVNTSDTKLFRKHRLVFGLDRVESTSAGIVIVEGYFDVIGAHRQGIRNAVAVMSAAISIEQIRKCNSETFTIALDGDAAGRQSTEKMVEILLSEGKKVYVARLPEGKDPDEIDFKPILDTALTADEYLLDLSDQHPMRALEILNECKDIRMKTDLNTQIAARMGIPYETIVIPPSRNLHFKLPQRNYDLESAVVGELQKRPDRLKEIIRYFDGVRPFSPDDFFNADYKNVFRQLLNGDNEVLIEVDDDCQNLVGAARSMRMKRLSMECARGEQTAFQEKALLMSRHF